MINARRFLCVGFTLMALAGCTGQRTTSLATRPTTTAPTSVPSIEVKVVKDLFYKSGESLTAYERDRCKLDLYLPEGKNFPVVVWFYGGGLESGDRHRPLHTSLAKTLASQGVACAVVDYRLSPKATYPAYLDDAAASVAWTLEHVAEYGGDPQRVFVSGHSAGAYLATQIGFDARYLQRYNVSTDQLAGLIPFSPQVFTHFTIRKERGLAKPETTPTIDDAAPAYHVRPDAPPTLIFIADKDWPARLEECQYFVRMAKLVKHPEVKLQVIHNRDHGSIAKKASDPNDPATTAMLAFIAKHRAQSRTPATTQSATK